MLRRSNTVTFQKDEPPATHGTAPSCGARAPPKNHFVVAGVERWMTSLCFYKDIWGFKCLAESVNGGSVTGSKYLGQIVARTKKWVTKREGRD